MANQELQFSNGLLENWLVQICHNLWQKDFTAVSFLKIYEIKMPRAEHSTLRDLFAGFSFSLKQFGLA
jgi:hypothetical protein